MLVKKRKSFCRYICLAVLISLFLFLIYTLLLVLLTLPTSANFESKLPPKVLYSILSGHATLERRLIPSSQTWIKNVSPALVFAVTDRALSSNITEHVKNVNIVLSSPTDPNKELSRNIITSWSHLVRVRLAWDHHLKEDRTIDWVFLADDDTYIFTKNLESFLTSLEAGFRPKEDLAWGGFEEYVRIDNGDSGKLAERLRRIENHSSGRSCVMKGEALYRSTKMKLLNKTLSRDQPVPNICDRQFCKACPSVPQGGAIIMSRSLVENLRPFLSKCEAQTRGLCPSCGSQRLYMCIHFLANEGQGLKDVRFLHAPGVERFPWRMTKKRGRMKVISLHGHDYRNDGHPYAKDIDTKYKALYTLENRIPNPDFDDVARM